MRPHGLFSWTDIALADPGPGAAFYADLFGWEAADQHDPDGNYIYTMFSIDGKAVAGLGQQPPGMQQAGVPAMWTCYVSVDNVDATLDRIKDAGGSVVLPAMDVLEAGRMAIAADPEGAVFALWQAGEHDGAALFSAPGAMIWNELATRDTTAAKAFYGDIMGWTFDSMDGPMEYWIAKIDADKGPGCAEDQFNGGVMAMDDDWPADLPAHWMVYFSVADTDASVARLTDLGGSVSVPAFDTPAGRIAVVADPQGGTFSFISPPQASE